MNHSAYAYGYSFDILARAIDYGLGRTLTPLTDDELDEIRDETDHEVIPAVLIAEIDRLKKDVKASMSLVAARDAIGLPCHPESDTIVFAEDDAPAQMACETCGNGWDAVTGQPDPYNTPAPDAIGNNS